MAKVRDASGEYDSTKGRIDPNQVTSEENEQDDEDIVDQENGDDERSTEDDELEEEDNDKGEEEYAEEGKDMEEEEDEEEKEDGRDPPLLQASHNDDDNYNDETQPLQPEKMFLGPSEYTKGCKIGTRCSVASTVKYIEDEFEEELKWFRNHYQFKHMVHMPKEPNHILQGMWMLCLCTVETEKESEAWFAVNGSPIRYSLREHALLTGLDCQEYPNNYKELGDLKFFGRMFGRTKGIKISDVEERLGELKKETKGARKTSIVRKNLEDRMTMTILWFLCKVVIAKSKAGGNIDSFVFWIVSDANACETFPWGRYTFDESMTEILCFVKGFKGSVKPKHQASFSGFILPLEVLAFESLPQLGQRFREVVPAEKDCQRLCKHKFKDSLLKGFPLEDINEALGSTKDIYSILEPSSENKYLLARIIDDDFDDGIGYVDHSIVDSWRERLTVERRNIWWKDLYDLDLTSRAGGLKDVEKVGESERDSTHDKG